MASVFTSVWQACFGWVNQLLFMDLPIYLGGYALNTLDIIVGTFGILIGVVSVRALVHSVISVAGSPMTNMTRSKSNDKDFVKLRASSYINKVSKGWDDRQTKLPK